MVRKNDMPIISKEEAGDLPTLKLNSGMVIESRNLHIEDENIKTEEDLQKLISFLYNEPECPCYYFKKRESPVNELLTKAENSGSILMNEYTLSFYKHPKSKLPRDYIHIIPGEDGKYRFEWEKEVVKKEQMYVRVKVELSERKKRELEVKEKIELEEEYKREKLVENKYDVFLSYSSEDQKEANLIYTAIQEAKGKVFLAKKCLKPGEDFTEKIREALYYSRKLWLLVSPSSLESNWVHTEWGAAWVLKKNIVPILHQCSFKDLPDRLSRFQCFNFYEYQELKKVSLPKK